MNKKLGDNFMQKLNITTGIVDSTRPNIDRYDLIDKVLDIYHPQFRFVKDIHHNEKEFTADIVVDKYPYTRHEIFSYVTGPSLTLIVGQVAYVFTASMIANNERDELRDISLEKYLYLRDKEKLVFGHLEFKFKKKIPANSKFEMTMKLEASKRMKNFIYGRFSFEVLGYLNGSTNFVMGLEHEEL